ncbi:MAG: LarC family nickel insertion protein [Gammaproteobacteria bacterium]
MRYCHLDVLGGVSGDMFLGAVLDAYPQLGDGAIAAVRAAGLPDDWQVRIERYSDHVLTGTRVAITAPARPSQPSGHFGAIRVRLQESPLAPAVRDHAIAIFTLLAEAEAAIHNTAIDDVHFHEIADWDSIADIVGAAFLIDALGAASWSVSALPLGSGRVRTEHGPLPVPAPATARLLEGFAMIDDGVAGERVTPTGAAILRHLQASSRRTGQAVKLTANGFGFGTRNLPGISNTLRLMVLDSAEPAWTDEPVALIAFEVDDQTPEDLATGLEAIRAVPGVLDALQTPAFGKKGRLGAHIQVLCRPDAVTETISACFTETTTLGLRWQTVQRATLRRTTTEVESAHGPIAVKIAFRPAGKSAKAEHDHIRHAGGQAERAWLRELAETLALRKPRDDNGN